MQYGAHKMGLPVIFCTFFSPLHAGVRHLFDEKSSPINSFHFQFNNWFQNDILMTSFVFVKQLGRKVSTNMIQFCLENSSEKLYQLNRQTPLWQETGTQVFKAVLRLWGPRQADPRQLLLCRHRSRGFTLEYLIQSKFRVEYVNKASQKEANHAKMSNKECFIFVFVPKIVSFSLAKLSNSQLCIVQSTALMMGPFSNSCEALFIQFRGVSSEIVVTLIFH